MVGPDLRAGLLEALSSLPQLRAKLDLCVLKKADVRMRQCVVLVPAYGLC
jgi:hypothetical protein